MGRMTDKEMLMLAYGAICVDAVENEKVEAVRAMVAEHLWPEPQGPQPGAITTYNVEGEDANDQG